jgi:hypothetical protein
MLSRSLQQRMSGALAAILLTACGDPTGNDPAEASSLAPSSSRSLARGQLPASVEWTAVARDAVARNRSSVCVAVRTYATVSVAQLEALRAAERVPRRDHVSIRAAVAAASAVALSYVYPA